MIRLALASAFTLQAISLAYYLPHSQETIQVILSTLVLCCHFHYKTLGSAPHSWVREVNLEVRRPFPGHGSGVLAEHAAERVGALS